MNTATAEPQFESRLHPKYVLGDKLGAEITELCAFLANSAVTVGARPAGDQICYTQAPLGCSSSLISLILS